MHSTNCLIENNIFQRLRHSMLVQLGANRNIFGYNYSREQHSTYIEPIGGNQITTTLGDLNAHAHYPYANLFEGNIVEAISADNYWGDNGPINTFFRNKITRNDNLVQMGGIHIQANYQNIIGNVLEDINDQFYYPQQYAGNLANFNGTPGSSGDAPCNDFSYYYEKSPEFLTGYTWPPVGTRTAVSTLTQKNPAYDRWNNEIKTAPALDISKWEIIIDAPILYSPVNGLKDSPLSTNFKWQKIKGAVYYKLELSEDLSFNSTLAVDTTTVDTSLNINNLHPNMHYFWRVKAYCNYGEANYSDIFEFYTITTGTFTLNGYVSYYNNSGNPLSGVEITLQSSNGSKKSTSTNKDGFFELLNLEKGNYQISCAKSSACMGVNSADALLAAKYFVGLLQLDALQFLSADVNNDSVVNSSDALFIQKKFINLASVYPNNKPDYVFKILSNDSNPSVFNTTNTVYINNNIQIFIKALFSGDVNKSFAE